MKTSREFMESKQFVGKSDDFPTQCFLKLRLVVSVLSINSRLVFSNNCYASLQIDPYACPLPPDRRALHVSFSG